MSFKVINLEPTPPMDITDLTSEMISDLLICYAMDVSPEDVECRHMLTERTSLTPTYPIIPKDIVSVFYGQLDIVKQTIIDIIIGNYHTGLYSDNRDGLWLWGNTPLTVTSLKDWLFFICKRDFNEAGTWIYEISQGDFQSLRPFFDAGVDLFLEANDHGDYDTVVDYIKEQYPFTHP